MFKVSYIIISASLSTYPYITNNMKPYNSPTLSQSLMTNSVLIKEQHEEITNSILIDSINTQRIPLKNKE